MTAEPPGSVEQSFRIAYRCLDGCLESRVDGRIETPEATLAMFLQIAAMLRQIPAPMLLILDGTEGVVPDEQDFARIVEGVRGSGLAGVRIAYVDRRGSAVARIEVGELVARSAGYAFRTFDNESTARLWLRYGKP